jgi:hypothetical protein
MHLKLEKHLQEFANQLSPYSSHEGDDSMIKHIDMD